jgi:hypothetical protein
MNHRFAAADQAAAIAPALLVTAVAPANRTACHCK